MAVGTMPGVYCRNSGTWGSPDAVKVGPPHVGPPKRFSRPRHKTSRWAPHMPHSVPMCAASTNKARDPGTLRGPLDPEAGMEVPGTRRPAGGQAHPREPTPARVKRISLPALAGSSQKTLAPRRWRRRGGQGRKSCQSLSALPGKGGRPYLPPLRRILGREEATSPPKKNPKGFSRQNPSGPKGAPVVSP